MRLNFFRNMKVDCMIYIIGRNPASSKIMEVTLETENKGLFTTTRSLNIAH